jgi:cytidylate kinase
MSIIIISSDSFERGQDITEKTAEALGYSHIGRALLDTVATKRGIPRSKLEKALEVTPSLLGMPTKVQRRYLAYIQTEALGQMVKDNIVCHDLAAHLYVMGVSHVLKVRILADPDALAEEMSAQVKVPLEKARKFLERRKKFHRRWSSDNFRLDETDPSHYDLAISLSQIDAGEAVKLIVETVGYRRFKPMTYSIKCINDIELASRVRATLLERFPDVRVRADGGTLVVETRALKREKRKKAQAIKELAGNIVGVNYVEVHVISDIFRQAAESFR